MDRVAVELGLDRAEIRRRNFIQPDEFPYDVGLTFQDGRPTKYDSGNYPEGLERRWKPSVTRVSQDRQAQAREEGRYLGLGIGCYVEGTGIGPYEGAHVRVDGTARRVIVATCVGTQGQSHQTVVRPDRGRRAGCAPGRSRHNNGRQPSMNWGSGTYASRSAVVTGNAIARLATRGGEGRALASELFEASEDDIELAEGRVGVKGSPDHSVSLWDIAVVANPIRYAYGEQAKEAMN